MSSMHVINVLLSFKQVLQQKSIFTGKTIKKYLGIKLITESIAATPVRSKI